MTGDLTDNVIIIGGGASGLMCAAYLSYLGVRDITVIDRNDRVGKKLLLTGNGRCNITNDNIDISGYNTDDRDSLERILSEYDVPYVKHFFEKELNIVLTSKSGLIYPYTMKSRTVSDGLRYYCEDHNVRFINDLYIDNISDNFVNGKYKADHIVCAMGGAAAPDTGSDGNAYRILGAIAGRENFTDICPSLVQFNIKDKDIKPLAGTRVNASVALVAGREEVARECGELMFTDYGVSGICVMQLSGIYNRLMRQGLHKACLKVDLFPDLTYEEVELEVRRRLGEGCAEKGSDVRKLSGMMLRNVAEMILKRDGPVVGNMKALTLEILGTRDFSSAQVTSGGIRLGFFNPDLSVPNNDHIYVIGETVNVDGPCGGYNLQWAWSSAMTAAKSIKERMS